MKDLKTPITITLILGGLSLASGMFTHLALTGIYHGKADLTMEWGILKASAMIFIFFIIMLTYTIIKALKKKP